MPGALVFDLDGTLIDSAADVRTALNALLVEEGRPPLSLDQVRALIGEGATVLIERAFAATGAPAAPAAVRGLVDRYLDHYRAAPADHTLVYDGVTDLLSGLRAEGWRLGVCTNKPQALSELVLATLGLAPFFDAVVGGDRPRRKPDGEHVRETLRQMGAAGWPAVYVGDSATDVAAARDAGLPIVAISWGYAQMDPRALGADRLIDHYRDLPATLSDLLGGGGAVA